MQTIEKYERYDNQQNAKIQELMKQLQAQEERFKAQLIEVAKNHQKLQMKLVETYENLLRQKDIQIEELENALRIQGARFSEQANRKEGLIQELQNALEVQKKESSKELEGVIHNYQDAQLQLMVKYEKYENHKDRQIGALRKQLLTQTQKLNETVKNHQNLQQEIIGQYERKTNNYENQISKLSNQLHRQNLALEDSQSYQSNGTDSSSSILIQIQPVQDQIQDRTVNRRLPRTKDWFSLLVDAFRSKVKGKSKQK